MRIDFDLTKEDYIAFSVHHMKNSPTIKKSLFIQRYILSLIFIAFAFIMANITEVPLKFWILAYIAIYIVWVIYYPKYFMSSTVKRIRKMINEGKNNGIFGPYSLTLTEDGIEESNQSGESRVTWGSIEKMEESEEHIFIYTSVINAYVVPVRAFADDEQRKEFTRLIRREKSPT
jgi:hypothetical protein